MAMESPAVFPNGSPRRSPEFEWLAASRREWIENVLRRWCRSACRQDLAQAEQEWTDLAGRVDPEFTLWLWAWERFGCLTVDGLKGLDESYEVDVRLRSGQSYRGFPDARRSRRGMLVLQSASGASPPLSLDDVAAVARASDASGGSIA